MTIDRYFEAIERVLAHLRTTQQEATSTAAGYVVETMRSGGVIYLSEVGHGLQGDFLNRAGGLVALQPFTWSAHVNSPVPKCRGAAVPETDDRDLERVRFAVRQSNLRAGDVMVVSSVSGRNRGPIELALACRELGMKTIGFTSFTYTARVESLHPSGKKLAEAVDVAIDIGAPYGDAGVKVPGYEHAAIPMSGLGQVVAGWMIWGTVMEQMAAGGSPASVLISHNSAGGPDWNETVRARYQTEGY